MDLMNDNLAAVVAKTIDDLAERLKQGMPRDREGVEPLIARITEMHRAAGALAEAVALHGGGVVKAAMRAGVPQEDLFGRPYVASRVRALAREAGLPPGRGGRPRIAPRDPQPAEDAQAA